MILPVLPSTIASGLLILFELLLFLHIDGCAAPVELPRAELLSVELLSVELASVELVTVPVVALPAASATDMEQLLPPVVIEASCSVDATSCVLLTGCT